MTWTSLAGLLLAGLLVACTQDGPTPPATPFWPPAAAPDLGAPRAPGPARDWKFLVFGDVRPDCQRDTYALESMQTLSAVRELAPSVDLVLGTGDYLCARPWQGAKAAEQVAMLKTLLPLVDAHTLYALGNHEMGHGDLLNRELGATPWGAIDLPGLRVVWLPSDTERSFTPPILDSLLRGAPRLVVIRHEPWGACGTTGDAWIRDRVRAAKPELILHGHVHTFALPGQELEECGRKLPLGPQEVVIGNGGAPGFLKLGWAGYTMISLPAQGPVTVEAYDTARTLRWRALLGGPR